MLRDVSGPTGEGAGECCDFVFVKMACEQLDPQRDDRESGLVRGIGALARGSIVPLSSAIHSSGKWWMARFGCSWGQTAYQHGSIKKPNTRFVSLRSVLVRTEIEYQTVSMGMGRRRVIQTKSPIDASCRKTPTKNGREGPSTAMIAVPIATTSAPIIASKTWLLSSPS